MQENRDYQGGGYCVAVIDLCKRTETIRGGVLWRSDKCKRTETIRGVLWRSDICKRTETIRGYCVAVIDVREQRLSGGTVSQ